MNSITHTNSSMMVKLMALLLQFSLSLMSAGLRTTRPELPESLPEEGFMDAFLYTPPKSQSFQILTASIAHEANFTKIRIPDTFVWHMHFHKAAGTSIGELAIRNGLKLAPHEPDSHGHLDLGNNNIQDTSAAQIVERLSTLRASGVGFGSTEHWFPDPSKLAAIQAGAPWVKFMTVLREPAKRTISSYFFHQNGGGRRCAGRCSVEQYAYAESNMMTRVLNGMPFGPEALDQPPTELRAQAAAIQEDQAAVSRAVSVLSSFALVLIQEKLSEESTRHLIRDKLGWAGTNLPHTNSHGHPTLSAANEEKIVQLNSLDSQLYSKYI